LRRGFWRYIQNIFSLPIGDEKKELILSQNLKGPVELPSIDEILKFCYPKFRNIE